ncbi:MAG: nitrous oxide reductase family maturation protein NosD [Candidatus Polarisedimenticolaceae bacterium]|nr:nitrous oxide reductase family maturation protein NosD [Candidatus Polarisedimenticolaceae bacterium]
MIASWSTSLLSAVSHVAQQNTPLQTSIDMASEGDTVTLGPGTWQGPLIINKSLTLRGEGGVIDGNGEGRVVVIDAPDVAIEGLTIKNSGDDLRKSEGCIYATNNAARAIIKNNRLVNCTFGIWLNRVDGAQVIANRIFGKSEKPQSRRGNGIHLHDGINLLIKDNHISGARDGIYISVTEESLIEANLTEQLRYGIHYMYSENNRLKDNISRNNINGFAIMQSHYLIIEGNQAYSNKNHGLLFRDAQYCIIKNNDLHDNGDGLFLFASYDNEIFSNKIANNKIGAKIWAGSIRNNVFDNQFIGNKQQIFYVSTQDLHWGKQRGNYWSDYIGWDQNSDLIGDKPYRVDSFTSNLLFRYPSAVLLLRSPSLELLAQLQQKMPVMKTPTLIDHAPLMKPIIDRINHQASIGETHELH